MNLQVVKEFRVWTRTLARGRQGSTRVSTLTLAPHGFRDQDWKLKVRATDMTCTNILELWTKLAPSTAWAKGLHCLCRSLQSFPCMGFLIKRCTIIYPQALILCVKSLLSTPVHPNQLSPSRLVFIMGKGMITIAALRTELANWQIHRCLIWVWGLNNCNRQGFDVYYWHM